MKSWKTLALAALLATGLGTALGSPLQLCADSSPATAPNCLDAHHLQQRERSGALDQLGSFRHADGTQVLLRETESAAQRARNAAHSRTPGRASVPSGASADARPGWTPRPIP